MKYLAIVLLSTVLLAACGSTSVEQNHPEDLPGKKSMLKEKRAELKKLSDEIARLEEEIEALQPAGNKSHTLVTTSKPERKDFRHFVEIQGSVQSDDLVSASAEVPGRIIKLTVKEGQRVHRGHLIARLDRKQLDKQIAELEKSLELAKDVYSRQKRLWDQNIGSEMQYLQAKNEKERLEKRLETLLFQLTKLNVAAPISGIIDAVNLKSGELASPGIPIVTILNTKKVNVVANVPENYLRAVRKGEKVLVKFPALNIEKEVRVSRIGSTIDPANRTFEVEVNMVNKSGLLKPNLLAVMVINDLSQRDVIVVPRVLIQQDVEGKNYVFIKKDGAEGSYAKKVFVKTGNSYQGEVIIEEGLTGDEVLINEGARGLAENELIKVAAN